MRTLEYGTTTHVPAFLTKLWKLVTDASCSELISWNYNGTSFIIYDEIRFSKELLPMYFKHNNMASFVRQLNMYGFRKLSCIDQGGMHCYKNEIEFYHQYFLKGQESLLELIKRKIPNSKSEEPRVKQEYIEELIASIKALKGKQDYTENGMRNLRRENKALWKHINFLTDRYSKQQSVLQQLLPFFMSMMRSNRERTLKRKSPLMIDEGETAQNKLARMSPPYYVHEQDSNMSMPSSPGNVSNRGPVIHDVTEMESSKMFPGSILCSANTAPECEVVVDSPLSCNLESSKRTIDSTFTEPGSMEALNIINQNFESRSRSSSMGSSIDMKPSPRSLASLNAQMASSSPTMSSSSSYLRTSSTPSTIIIDENTSDVPLMNGSFATKIENNCTENGMYNMSSLMNERVSGVIDEETVAMLENPSLMNGGPSNAMGEASASNGGKFMPNFFTSQMKEGMEMNWMLNQPPPPEPFGPEPSLENWLGQLIKSDNLTPGCSLPQTSPALSANINFGYVNYPEKRT